MMPILITLFWIAFFFWFIRRVAQFVDSHWAGIAGKDCDYCGGWSLYYKEVVGLNKMICYTCAGLSEPI